MCGYLDTNMWHVMNATTGSPSASALSGQVGTESVIWLKLHHSETGVHKKLVEHICKIR